jgi:hypothetical protein
MLVSLFYKGIVTALEQLTLFHSVSNQTFSKLAPLTSDTVIIPRPPFPDFAPQAFNLPDAETINARNVFAGLDPYEISDMQHYLEDYKPPHFADIDENIACLLLRILVPGRPPHSKPVMYFINRAGESLFGYTCQEFQHYLDVKHLQNLWILKTTGMALPPAGFS